MAERRSYDLDSDDIAIETWLRAPDTPLPKLLSVDSDNLRFIDFTGTKLEHKNAKGSPEVAWAKSLSFDNNDVLHARMRLLFAWPDDGQPLDVQLYHLEVALDAALGIKRGKTSIPPALSRPLGGNSETADEDHPRRAAVGHPVRRFNCACGFGWNMRSDGRPSKCPKKGCGALVRCGSDERVHIAQANHQRDLLLDRLAELQIVAEGDIVRSKIGVRILGCLHGCQHNPPLGFLTLKSASSLVDQLELDAIEKRIRDTFAHPPTLGVSDRTDRLDGRFPMI